MEPKDRFTKSYLYNVDDRIKCHSENNTNCTAKFRVTVIREWNVTFEAAIVNRVQHMLIVLSWH